MTPLPTQMDRCKLFLNIFDHPANQLDQVDREIKDMG